MMADADSNNSVEEMSYRELQSEAKRLGIKASGKRNELVARLQEHLSSSGGTGGGGW